MVKNTGRSRRVVRKRRSSGRSLGRRWRSWARRGGVAGRGFDGTSDEEYVVSEDEEDGTSSGSYSSDASRVEPQAADITSCTEEEEEEVYDVSDDEELAAAAGRWPRKRPTKPPPRRAKSTVPARRVRESLARPRRRKRIPEDSDEDFAPDDDGEEQWARPAIRRTGRTKNGPVKRQRGKEKRKKAPVKKRRRRTVQSSDDDDFVVEDEMLVEGINRANERSSHGRKSRTNRRRLASISDDDDFVVKGRVSLERINRQKRRKKSLPKGKKRTLRASRSEVSDSNTSDFDYTISEEELRDLQVGGPLGRREQKTVSPVARSKEKGKGKRIDDLEKQICGICLSEEQKGVIRGLLDCCSHYFCFACIMEWSKVESRCPLCKQRFKTVAQSARSGAGLSLRPAVKRIPKRDQVYQPSAEEARNYRDPYADVVCMECQQGGDDHLLLLCDICDSSAHTYCVGLGREVPEGNWYCGGCRPMVPGSSNSHVQESAVEHQVKHSDSLQDTSGEVNSENITNCIPHETPGRSATLPSPHQSPSGIGQDASSRCHSSLGDYGTASPASGFAASTVSRRRSIHEHIRLMLLNHRLRQMPEGVARNVVAQPSSVESDCFSPEVEQPGKSLVNGTNEGSNQLLSVRRGNLHPCMHNEVSSSSIVEAAKAQVQSMVKNHLKYLTRDNYLERRDFKDIARRATHTILAACGVEHRGSMVAMLLQPPSSCAHRTNGELTSLVKDCCSSCFASFVGNVVQRLVHLKFQSTGFHT